MTDTAVRTCRSCGCTDERACLGGCWWVEVDLCSTCQRRQRDAQSLEDHAAAVGEDLERQRLDDLDWAEAQAWEDE